MSKSLNLVAKSPNWQLWLSVRQQDIKKSSGNGNIKENCGNKRMTNDIQKKREHKKGEKNKLTYESRTGKSSRITSLRNI